MSRNIILILASVILAVWAGKAPVYDLNIVPDACVKAPPVRSNYTPTGSTWNLGDLPIYETLRSNMTNGKRILIDVYDIFGMTENTMQVADVLALDGNFRIVVPDFFRGSPFNVDNFPPKDPTIISKFLETKGAWEDYVQNDTLRVINHFKQTENITSFGIFGFCWGGKISVQAASNLTDIKVAALVHPSSVTTEEANWVKAPMYLLPSMNEPDMIPFFSILVNRLGANNTGHRRFDNMPHGFSGARGNFSNPENIKAVDEVITIIKDFFTAKL